MSRDVTILPFALSATRTSAQGIEVSVGKFFRDEKGRAFRIVRYSEAVKKTDAVGYRYSGSSLMCTPNLTSSTNQGFAGIVQKSAAQFSYGYIQCGGLGRVPARVVSAFAAEVRGYWHADAKLTDVASANALLARIPGVYSLTAKSGSHLVAGEYIIDGSMRA